MNYTHAADKVRIVVLVGIGSFRTLDQQFVECLLLFFFPVIVCWKLWLIVCQLPQIFHVIEWIRFVLPKNQLSGLIRPMLHQSAAWFELQKHTY
jgi:hypothetical protein